MFISNEKALSVKDFEDGLADYDRVTIYRTLNSFTEKGLIHRIPGDEGFANYGLCHLTCTPDHHVHEHLHFKCNKCNHTECIHISMPQINLPGYIVEETNLILNGVCKNCVRQHI